VVEPDEYSYMQIAGLIIPKKKSLDTSYALAKFLKTTTRFEVH
jgi:hypothetical protein